MGGEQPRGKGWIDIAPGEHHGDARAGGGGRDAPGHERCDANGSRGLDHQVEPAPDREHRLLHLGPVTVTTSSTRRRRTMTSKPRSPMLRLRSPSAMVAEGVASRS